MDGQQSQEAEYERLGHKQLTLVDVVAQSVGFMGPVFSSAFLIPAIAGIISATGKGAGIAAPLAVLIAAIGVFALGWIVAQYSKRIHAAGSLYDYVSNGLGRTLGAATGWLYYGGTIVLTCGLGVLVGGFIHDTIQAEFNREPLPIWAWNVLWAVALFLVLYLGVQISTRVQLTLALISVAVVLTFFIYVIVKVGGDNDVAKAFDPSGSTTGDLNGVLFGVLYGVLIFVGFETAANLAEETSQPKRQIPRAVMFSVVAVSIFYLIASYAQVAGFGFHLDTLASAAAAPLFALASPAEAGGFGSTTLVRIMELVVLFDILAVGVGAAVASTRGVFAMARDRRLPAPLASVSSRFGTPTGSIAFLIFIQALFILGTEFWDDLFALPETPHYFAIFLWGSTFGGFALVVVYLLMSLGSLFGLRDLPNRVGLWISAILGLAISGGAIYGSFADVTSPILLGPVYALVLFGVGLLASFVFKGREPAVKVIHALRTHQE
ncbi:MAG TPA: APC family permease [Actinomycetota bacterium]